jgi:hypothetical protein
LLLTVYRNGVVVNISTATVKRIVACRPDGTVAWTKDASFETTGSDGKVYIVTTSTADLNVEGTWRAQVYIEMGSYKGYTLPEEFPVYENVTPED